MLIISPERFLEELENLVEWKRMKGFQVELASTEQIGSSAATIQSHIREAYETWIDPPLSYVLLVGDLEDIPPSYLEQHHVTDAGYARLSGEDILPDVWIGRLSASKDSEIADIVKRIIDYERSDSASKVG